MDILNSHHLVKCGVKRGTTFLRNPPSVMHKIQAFLPFADMQQTRKSPNTVEIFVALRS